MTEGSELCKQTPSPLRGTPPTTQGETYKLAPLWLRYDCCAIIQPAARNHSPYDTQIGLFLQNGHIVRTIRAFHAYQIAIMNITLGNEFERRIAEKVNTGLYSSSSEVIREGLRLLFERDAIREQQLSILQREVAAGFRQLDAAQINSQSVTTIFDKELSKPL